MEIEIELDSYNLTVEVTRLINDQPDPTCRDSADDCRGVKEVEWQIVYATEFKEGRPVQCGYLPKWLRYLERELSEEIEAAIWAKYEEGQ